MKDLALVQAAVGYQFRDLNFLQDALRHSSAIDVAAVRHSERLEFLGDAIVAAALGELLIECYPECDEGQLSRYRAALANTQSLAAAARDLGVAEWIVLGRGEERSGGRAKVSILAAAYESIVGAIFLDGGYEAARTFLRKQFRAAAIELATRRQLDPKTEFQEHCQALYRRAPEYRVVEESGPQHQRRFVVDVVLGEQVLARGGGTSKREAEQDAARAALGLSADQLAELVGSN